MHDWLPLQDRARAQESLERNLGIAAGISFGVAALLPISLHYKVSTIQSLVYATLGEIAAVAIAYSSYQNFPNKWTRMSYSLTQCEDKEKACLRLVPDAMVSIDPSVARLVCSKEEFEVAENKQKQAEEWKHFLEKFTEIEFIFLPLLALTGLHRLFLGAREWHRLSVVAAESLIAGQIGIYSLLRRAEEVHLRSQTFTERARGYVVYKSIPVERSYIAPKVIKEVVKVELPILSNQELKSIVNKMLDPEEGIEPQDRLITVFNGCKLTLKGIEEAFKDYPENQLPVKLVIKIGDLASGEEISYGQWVSPKSGGVEIWRGLKEPANK